MLPQLTGRSGGDHQGGRQPVSGIRVADAEVRHRPAAAEGEASGDPVAGAVSRQRGSAGGAGGLRL